MTSVLTTSLERLDTLELKERVLLTIAAVVVLGMLWVKFVFDPVSAERRQLQAKVSSLQTRTQAAHQLAAEILELARRDPNQPLREQVAATDRSINEARSEIAQIVGELVPPKQMAKILRQVLEQTHGLQFTQLEGLGAQALHDDADESAADDQRFTAYRHGFRIRFNGSYLDTLAYLQALEQLPWRLFWDAVDIDVGEHPDADVSVTVYTLSVERSWIGV